MADFSWSPIIAAFVAAGGAGLLNHLSNARLAGKTEGVITQRIDDIGKNFERHERENERRFQEVGEEIKEAKRESADTLKDLRETDRKQWDKISEQGQEIVYLKAKVNGKPATAGGD